MVWEPVPTNWKKQLLRSTRLESTDIQVDLSKVNNRWHTEINWLLLISTSKSTASAMNTKNICSEFIDSDEWSLFVCYLWGFKRMKILSQFKLTNYWFQYRRMADLNESTSISWFEKVLKWMMLQTLRLNRSTIFKNMKLAAIWVTETKIEESFGEIEEPVFVNISVT